MRYKKPRTLLLGSFSRGSSLLGYLSWAVRSLAIYPGQFLQRQFDSEAVEFVVGQWQYASLLCVWVLCANGLFVVGVSGGSPLLYALELQMPQCCSECYLWNPGAQRIGELFSMY